jgi:hypothetical protein
MEEISPFDGSLRIIGKRGQLIRTVPEWESFASPAGRAKQWKDCRSAKEVARAWVGSPKPVVPKDLESLLDSEPKTRAMTFGCVTPEARLRLDRRRGNTRNTDVLAYGRAGGRPTVVAIEAKADESFGPRLGTAADSGRSKNSKVRERVDELCEALFGRPLGSEPTRDPELASIRYQLVHGLIGVLNEATDSNAQQAVFVIHEFRSRKGTRKSRLEANQKALETFLRALKNAPPKRGALSRLKLPAGSSLSQIPVFVGKAVTELKDERCA